MCAWFCTTWACDTRRDIQNLCVQDVCKHVMASCVHDCVRLVPVPHNVTFRTCANAWMEHGCCPCYPTAAGSGFECAEWRMLQRTRACQASAQTYISQSTRENAKQVPSDTDQCRAAGLIWQTRPTMSRIARPTYSLPAALLRLHVQPARRNVLRRYGLYRLDHHDPMGQDSLKEIEIIAPDDREETSGMITKGLPTFNGCKRRPCTHRSWVILSIDPMPA